MVYKDLRDFLTAVEGDGELKRISGADWNLEMASIAELIYRHGKRPTPTLLFDDIPGYPKGYRTLFGWLSSPRRMARALCLSLPDGPMQPLDAVKAWAAKAQEVKLIPPKFVASAPVQENSFSGDEVNITKFPAPKCHELDGGRYIGIGHAVIQRDPDDGWVNLGTYRCMVTDRNHFVFHALEGQHGRVIHDKYFERGQVMPIAIAMGMDPSLHWGASQRVEWGVSEYDYAGGIKGEPIEVFEGPLTGLPLPATAEIVIEGECHPGELAGEGPYGEWHGYYANLGLTPVPEPVVRVKAIYHRNDPILTCSHPAVPPGVNGPLMAMGRAAALWMALDRIGVPGIIGVWSPEQAGAHLAIVVSIQQMYAGHSKEVGFLASQLAGPFGRWTIVVDDDIDPSNLDQVFWAITTRADPERSIQFQQGCVSSSADPVIPWAEKSKYKTVPKPLTSTRVVIDACRPYEYKEEWYPIAKASPQLQERLFKKWDSLFKELC